MIDWVCAHDDVSIASKMNKNKQHISLSKTISQSPKFLF